MSKKFDLTNPTPETIRAFQEYERKKFKAFSHYLSNIYKQRRKELGYSMEEIAQFLQTSIETIEQSETTLDIGLDTVFTLGDVVYKLDMQKIWKEAIGYAEAEADRQEQEEGVEQEGAEQEEGAEQ